MTLQDPIPKHLIALTKLSDEVARRGGNRISRSTIYRWVYRGLKGRKLRTVTIGGTAYTTWEWLLDMTSGENQEPPTSEGQRQSVDEATRSLISEGL